jgi:hypothetical protein
MLPGPTGLYNGMLNHIIAGLGWQFIERDHDFEKVRSRSAYTPGGR